jgi:hypothetical protein
VQDLAGSRWEGFTVLGQPLAGGCAQDSGKPDGAVTTS